jgi:hypothetical protein
MVVTDQTQHVTDRAPRRSLSQILLLPSTADWPTHPHLPSQLPAPLYRDRRIGEARAIARRLFEPVFTTKFSGRGLGFAARQGFARSHHGDVTAAGDAGRGSAFRLYLRQTAQFHPVP